jgi:hypothetical protein
VIATESHRLTVHGQVCVNDVFWSPFTCRADASFGFRFALRLEDSTGRMSRALERNVAVNMTLSVQRASYLCKVPCVNHCSCYVMSAVHSCQLLSCVLPTS